MQDIGTVETNAVLSFFCCIPNAPPAELPANINTVIVYIKWKSNKMSQHVFKHMHTKANLVSEAEKQKQKKVSQTSF